MAVRLRLKRFGRRNRPFYRICAIDGRRRRDGRTLEDLGFYDPTARDAEKQYKLNTERIRYWLAQGAEPSETVRDLLRKSGIQVR